MWKILLLVVFLKFLSLYLQASDKKKEKIAAQEVAQFLSTIDIESEMQKDKKDVFKQTYGADDEMIGKALAQERDNTPLAEHLRNRLFYEADVDCMNGGNVLFQNSHPISLAILAQSGKIPNDMIDLGFNWAETGLGAVGGVEMMERFVRWYDTELINHGVPEHLRQKKPNRNLDQSLRDNNLLKTVEIQSLNKLDTTEVLFWASTGSEWLPGCSLYEYQKRYMDRFMENHPFTM